MHLAANNYEDFKATVIENFWGVITLVTDMLIEVLPQELTITNL